MTTVTRPAFASTACVLALCVASASVRAQEGSLPPAAPALAASESAARANEGGTSASGDAPAASVGAAELDALAPIAGAVGAAVGVGVGGVVALGTTWGLWSILSAASLASSGGWAVAVAGIAQLATPVLLVGLPTLGAGLGAFGTLALVTDTSAAALGGVTAAVATPIGAVAGGVAGGAAGALGGLALVGGNTGGWNMLGVLLFGFAGGVLGAGVGGVLGATSGGAVAGLVVAAVE